MRFLPYLLLLTIASPIFAAAPTSKPASATTRASTRRDSKNPALAAAIQILTQEFQASQKQPSSSSLRTESNYFKEHPSPDITPEVILPVLLQNTGDPRLQAYVKWQLLSALQDSLDEKLAPKFLAAYRAAPAPSPRPTISQIEQKQLDRAVMGRKEADKADLEVQLDNAVSRVHQDNQPILAYRDALYHKLPKNIETFAAALDDAHQRLNCDADAKDLLKDFDKDVRGWALTSTQSPQSLLALARATRKLATEKGPEFYKTLYWNERNHAFNWRKAHADLGDEKALADLAVFLEEQASAPPLKSPK